MTGQYDVLCPGRHFAQVYTCCTTGFYVCTPNISSADSLIPLSFDELFLSPCLMINQCPFISTFSYVCAFWK